MMYYIYIYINIYVFIILKYILLIYYEDLVDFVYIDTVNIVKYNK